MNAISNETTMQRSAPHNIEAEQALLGAILINNEVNDRVSSFLEPAHFFDSLHQRIYEVVGKLIASGNQATPISLRTFFETAAPIDAKVTVAEYLSRLVANATSMLNARDYGRIVYDLAIRRNLITIGEGIVNAAYDSPVDAPPKAQIEDAEAALYALAERGMTERAETTLQAAAAKAIEAASEAHRRGGGLAGLSTGIGSLDKRLGGLAPGDLVILAGRPGMGKSAAASTIAINAALGHTTGQAAVPVAFYSLEMSDSQLAGRILSTASGVPAWALRNGSFSQRDMEKVLAANERLANVPLIFDQSAGLTIAQLYARARRLKRKRGIGLIVVDYLQLMRPAGRHANRVGELTEITTGLKSLAKELEVPIIALSQLSRQVEGRADKRPQLSDLRESGSIEQDADVVMFVYREEYYLAREQPQDHDVEGYARWSEKLRAAHGKSEIIIAKHRHGPTGTVELAFDVDRAAFTEPRDDAAVRMRRVA